MLEMITGQPLLVVSLLVGVPALLLAIVAVAYFVWTITTTNLLMWFITKIFYPMQVFGKENVPLTGPAMLTPNHLSWMDGVLVAMASPRRPLFVVWAPVTKQFWAKRLTKKYEVIPVEPTPQAARDAIRRVREALLAGRLVCVFPEGALSRTGQLMPFQRGVSAMLKGTNAPVIPVHLGGMWGSLFSNSGGRFFWKWPSVWRRQLQIRFGKPMLEIKDVGQISRAVQDLEREYIVQSAENALVTAPQQLIRECRRAGNQVKVVDSLGQSLTGRQLLLKTLVLQRVLRRLLGQEEKQVGLLIPPSAGGVLANAALAVDRRVAVNLNYTISPAVLSKCIESAGIKHVLTSRRFLEKVKLEVNSNCIYLEDLPQQATAYDKALAAMATYLMPNSVLERWLSVDRIKPNDLLTIIFTSGSTGEPKGVMLSHNNVRSNVLGFNDIVRLTADDSILGILPFFHSFGYTATLWAVLLLKVKGIYHANPLDAGQVGKLVSEHKATVLMGAPTFLRGYLRRCQPEQFKSLAVVVAGAEKLPAELNEQFKEKFGVGISEGYGCTETSPVVSVNIPATRAVDSLIPSTREGTVGRPIPGVVVRVANPETFEPLPAGEVGMLLVSGSGVMQGYWNHPEATAKVMREGWYITGDLASIDDDGFVQIAGRLSRFAKIGGEMVPHIKVEESIKAILGTGQEVQDVAITSLPDPKKGEKLVVLHTTIAKTPAEICQELAAAGLPNLFIPDAENFLEVEAIPLLGTGKLDLRGLKQLAENRMSAKSGSPLTPST